jgi:hypothetical protein
MQSVQKCLLPLQAVSSSQRTGECFGASYFTLGKALALGPFRARNVSHSHLKTKKISKSFSVSSWWMHYCIESFFSKGLAHEGFTLHQLTALNCVNPQSTFCVCICNSNLMVL